MKPTLQARLMATFLLMITVLAGVALLIFVHARATTETYQTGLSNLLRVAELTEAVDRGAVTLGRLATDPSPDRTAQDFQPIREQIQRLRLTLPTTTANPSSRRLLLDLDNMADSFLIEATAAIYAFRGGNLELYFRHDREAAAIAGYVRDTADHLLAAELDAYRRIYPEVIRRDRQLQQMNLAVLAGVVLVGSVFAWSFARNVTDPIQALVKAARRIARQDLEGPPVPEASGLELQVLANTFNHMQESLRQHMRELKEKAELQRRLQAEELENLQIHSLLRDAELRALQSQVNPHFLFNTLNMLVKTALIEGAERTGSLLETVADLLRYSLRQLDRPVTLKDELEQVRRYMAIQTERFRDRFHFLLEVDESALDIPIPCLTLQPLVENAVIHGIGPRENGGAIRLTVRRLGQRVRITLEDEGVGIAPDRLPLLNARDNPATGAGGHTTGLGLHNVRRRLELFYGETAQLSISSRFGQGSRVLLELPSPQREVVTIADPGGR